MVERSSDVPDFTLPSDQGEQAEFGAKFGLNFPLLADEHHSVAEAYGVWGETKWGSVSSAAHSSSSKTTRWGRCGGT